MALFGSSKPAMAAQAAYQPGALSKNDKMMLFGSMLSDLGRGGGIQNIAAVQQMIGARQAQQLAEQRRLAGERDLAQMFAPPPADPNEPTPVMSQAMSIPSTGTGAPALNLPQINAAPTRQAPKIPKINDGATIAKLLALKGQGVDIAPVLDVMKANQPNVTVGPGGEAYDQRDGSNIGRTFRSPTQVNGFNFDENDPNAPKYLPQLEKGQEPLYDARGQVVGVRNMDGAIKSIADMKQAETMGQKAGELSFAAPIARATVGATEEAKAQYDLVDIPLPDGSTIKMRRADYLAQTQGAAPQGGQGGGAAPPGGLGRSQAPADKVYAEGQAKDAAEQFKTLQTSGQQALANIPKYQRIGQLLDGVNGNKLSPLGLDLAQYARSIPGLEGIDPKLSNKEAAKAISNQIALSLRGTADGGGMPGAMSDADRNYLVQMVPRLEQSDAGRKIMIESAIKLNQRNADVAAMARKWQQRYGRLDATNPTTGKSFFDNLNDWSSRNALFGAQQ